VSVFSPVKSLADLGPLSNSESWRTIVACGYGQQPTVEQMQRLQAWTIESRQLEIWQIPVPEAELALKCRLQLLQTFCQQLKAKAIRLPVLGTWADWIVPLWLLWLPLAQQLDRSQRASNTPFVQGLLGGQGTGKTTLTKIVCLILACLEQRAVGCSIDDLYLSYEQRQQLRQQDPRLVWRGPPGTHDVELGVKMLTTIKQGAPGQSVAIPRFDKSLYGGQGDRIAAEWVQLPSIVLLEGWLVGVQPLPASEINSADFPFPSPILTAADKQFSRDCNHRLESYQQLWSLLDSLVVLQPEDYRYSLRWRQSAELQMIAQGKMGLSVSQITEFVNYFWKALHPELFITPLACHKNTRLVVTIDFDHQINHLCLP